MTRSPRPRTNLSDSVDRQLNMYALAAGATGVAALALAYPAEAKVVYTPAHTKVVGGHPVGLDLNHDGIIDFYLAIYGSFYTSALSACQYLAGSVCSFSRGKNAVRIENPNAGYWGAALRYGATIQRGDRFATANVRLGEEYASADSSNPDWAGPWLNGGKGVKDRYLGLKLQVPGRVLTWLG